MTEPTQSLRQDHTTEPAPLRTLGRCPVCRRPAVQEMRPFCSKRCADVDLHRWLGGVYRVPAQPDHDEDDQAGEGEAASRRDQSSL